MDLQSRLNSSLVQSSTNQTVVDAYGLILMPLALQAGQENEVQKWQFRYHTFAILFVAGYVLLLALGYKLNKLCSITVSGLLSSLFCFVLFSKLQCMNNVCTSQLINLAQARTIALVCSIFLLAVTLIFYYITSALLAIRHALNVAILLLIACPFVFFYGVLGLVGTILRIRSLESSRIVSIIRMQYIQLELYLYYATIVVVIWVFFEDLCYIRLKAYNDFRTRADHYLAYLHHFEQQQYHNMFIDQYFYFRQLFDRQQQLGQDSSPVPPSCRSYSASEYTIPIIRSAHQWSIEQFIRRDHSAQAPEFIRSSEFALSTDDQVRFYLQIYPRGIEKRNQQEECVSLYLHCSPPMAQQSESTQVTVGFVCSIIDSLGLKRELKEKRCTFTAENTLHGWSDFVSRNHLLNSANRLLPGERLTIHCEISYVTPNDKQMAELEKISFVV